MSELIHITTNEQGLQVVESRIVAQGLNIEHRALMQTIDKYQSTIEAKFGLVTFEMLPRLKGQHGGSDIKIAYLNEAQCLFVGSLSKNTDKVVDFKVELVDSFEKAKSLVNNTAVEKTTEQTLAEAFVLAQNVIAAKDEEIKKLAPKAEYTDVVLRAQNTINTRDVAKSIGITAQELNKFLVENHIVYKRDDHYLLYAQYQGKGYEKMLTNVKSTPDGRIKTYLQLVWTEYGRAFINYKYNNLLTRPKGIPVSTVNNRVGAYK